MSRLVSAAATLLSGLIVAAACGPRGRPVAIEVVPALQGVPLRVHVGRSWNTAPAGSAQALDGRSFTVAAGADVVVPFVDLDGDGRLDKLSEPSADCGRSAGFACQVGTARMMLRRFQRSGAEKDPQAKEDVTLVMAEAYDARPLAVDKKARLCRTDTGECQSRDGVSPYLDVPEALTIKLCELNAGAKPGDVRFPLELRSGERKLLTASFTQPPAMQVQAQLKRQGDHLSVVLRAALPIHQHVVWLGRGDPANAKAIEIVWNSEEDPPAIERQDGGLVVNIGKAPLARCGDRCLVGVQAASNIQSGAVSISSEGAALLVVPGSAS